MDIIDVETGKKIISDDPSEIGQGILDGRYSASGRLNVFKNDEVFSIDAKDLNNSLANGWQIETPNLAATREYLKENDGLVGNLKVGAYEFGNALTLGVPDIIMRNTQNPLEWAKFNALRDEHVTASLLGQIGGTGANIYSLAKAGVLAATEKIAEKAVSTVAGRISATLGGKVSQAAAQKAARGILAKTAGKMGQGAAAVTKNVAQSAIEGAIDMSVPASVEALFGNFDEAAETLLVGTAFGGILGGGVRTAADAVGAAKNAFKGFTGEGKAQETALQFMSTQLNIPIDTLRYGFRNAADVDNAVSKKVHFDKLNRAAANELDLYKTAQGDLKSIEEDLIAKTNYKSTQMNELISAPNKAIDDHVVGSTTNMKLWLDEQSKFAEDALASEISMPIIPIADHAKKLESAIARLKKSEVGRSRKASISTLENMLEDLRALPERLDGSEARDVMRAIREDIDFNASAANPAGFSDIVDRNLKTLQRSLSDEIKYLSPSYKEFMDAMSPKAQALNDISKFVDSDTKRLAIGKALATDNPSPAQLVLKEKMDNFLNEASTIEGLENVRDVFDEAIRDQRSANIYKKNRRAMVDNRTGEARDAFYREQFPTEYELLVQRRQAFTNAEEKFKALKPLVTDQGTVNENNIKFMSDDKNIQLSRAYDELGKRYPQELGDIKKGIKDTLIKESFDNARTQGSRAALLYASLLSGTAGATMGPVGALLGVAAGAATGAYVDRFGGRIFNKLLKDTPTATRIRSLLVAERQMGEFARGLDNIPKHIDQIATKKDQASAVRKINSATNRILLKFIEGEKQEKSKRKGKEADGGKLLDRETRVKAFNNISKKFAELRTGEAFYDELAAMSEGVRDGGSEMFASKIVEKMQIGFEYLDSVIPKNPDPASPFQADTDWEPSDFDLSAFEDALLVVSEPMIVFDALEGDVINRNHIDALKAVYPSLYGHITNKVMESLSDRERFSKMSYADKVGLSYVLDMPLDNSMSVESYVYFQSKTANQNPDQDIDQGQPQTNFKPNLNIGIRNYRTTTQNLREV